MISIPRRRGWLISLIFLCAKSLSSPFPLTFSAAHFSSPPARSTLAQNLNERRLSFTSKERKGKEERGKGRKGAPPPSHFMTLIT